MAASSPSSCFAIATAANPRNTPIHGAHGAVVRGLSIPRNYVQKNAGGGSRRLLPAGLLGTPLRLSAGADEHKGCLFAKRQLATAGGMIAVARASTCGKVEKVERASQKEEEVMYYNVGVRVSCGSEVAKCYTTPGMYVNMMMVDSQYDCASAFFIASPPTSRSPRTLIPDPAGCVLEFLIEDVPDTVAHEIINSKPGDRVVITTDPSSHGFDLPQIEDAESVVMFAAGYGLGPFRALIERGFQANKKKHACLYTMYNNPNEEPYVDCHPAWEETGIKIQRGVTQKPEILEPENTVVLIVATKKQQQTIAKCFESNGVPEDNIQTLFEGIPEHEHAFYNKVIHKLFHHPKFPHSGPTNVPVELKI